MAKLIKCKDCGAEISKKAAACPQCGRVLKKKNGCLKLIGLIAFIFVAAVGIAVFSALNEKPVKRANIEVSRTPTHLIIKNTHGAEIEGKWLAIYINDEPYKNPYIGGIDVPAFGESAQFPLRAATRKNDGAIFDPETHRVTSAWIGGDGYGIAEYTF